MGKNEKRDRNDTEENHTGPIVAQNVNLAWFKTNTKCQTKAHIVSTPKR